MHLAALHIHPVKSLRALNVDAVEIDTLGAVGDRRFLVVDPQGNFLTQRTVARMALVDALLDDATLTLRSEGFGELRLRRHPDPAAPLVAVKVWKSEGLKAEDCGDAASAWLSRVIETACRLVRIGPAFSRPVTKAAARPGDLVGFADAVPFLIVCRSSLDHLNDRIVGAGGEPVPMDRFRPNLVIEGAEPFSEDRWRTIRIGAVVLRNVGPCARCIVTTTDQALGTRGVEPLRTLATFRRDPNQPTYVNFGQNLVHDTKKGVLRVGEVLEVLE